MRFHYKLIYVYAFQGRQGYQAYEDGEPDEYGFFKQKEVLGMWSYYVYMWLI